MRTVLAAHVGGFVIACGLLIAGNHLGLLKVSAGGWFGMLTVSALTFLSVGIGIWREDRRRKINEDRLRMEAHIDRLTKLPNRLAFEEELERTLARASRRGTMFGVMFIDLDGLKAANDTYGHDAGDQLLFEAANRLQMVVRTEDMAARLGGDEYTVILGEVSSADDALVVGKRVVDALSQPLSREGWSLPMAASAGIAIFPAHARSVFGLIKAADRAMYVAKSRGGNRCEVAAGELEGGAASFEGRSEGHEKSSEQDIYAVELESTERT